MSKRSVIVVFDFDGTLIDSRDAKENNYVRAFLELFPAAAGQESTVRSSARRTAGANRFIQLQDTLAATGTTATDEERERWSQRYSELNNLALHDTPEFPAVRATLEQLKSKGHRLFATSGILESEFLGEMRRRRLGNLFEDVRGGDKETFLKQLREQNDEPLVFVGDTDFDQLTAAGAGAAFYRVTGNRDLEELPQFVSTFASKK